jgi:hypothetical protein
MSSNGEEFFSMFYGSPDRVQRPMVEFPCLSVMMSAEKRASMLRSMHARSSVTSP